MSRASAHGHSQLEPQKSGMAPYTTGVCETLMSDVVMPEAHQKDRSYVSELSGPTFDPLRIKLQHGGRLHEGPQNWEWALARGWALAPDNTVVSYLHFKSRT